MQSPDSPHPETPSQRRRISAATIVVLMLATPVVGTLLLYVFVFFRTRYTNNMCQEHLATLGKAFVAYAGDHHGTLPKATDWTAALKPYVNDNEAFRCPHDLTEGFSSYAMNEALSGKKLSSLKNTSHLVLLYEVDKSGTAPHGDGENIFNLIGHKDGGEGRHGANFYRFNYYLLADGSVNFPRISKDIREYVWRADGTNTPRAPETPEETAPPRTNGLTF